VSQQTISRYLDYLEDSFLINKAMRYDVKGRKYISTPVKYYFSDVGLRNARLNFRQQEESHIMENVIYNELLRRGYSIDVGVVEVNNCGAKGKRQLEIDFVANMGSRRLYIQSALELSTSEKMAQEKSSLVNVADSFKKIIVQRNPVEPWYDDDGILHVSLIDFLLLPEVVNW
jgi:predicted AAA+ superfamily ATPase